jgi:hypothetical protein
LLSPKVALKADDGTRVHFGSDGYITIYPAGRLGGLNFVQEWGKATTACLSPTAVLYLYAETNAAGTANCTRLRYLKTSDAGRVVTDVMLLHDLIPPS